MNLLEAEARRQRTLRTRYRDRLRRLNTPQRKAEWIATLAPGDQTLAMQCLETHQLGEVKAALARVRRTS